jgi:ribosome biogenesis GTPase A
MKTSICNTSIKFVDNRGFMTANGQPDNPRSARYILKDFVNGKLLYAHAPPGVAQDGYISWIEKTSTTNRTIPPREFRATRVCKYLDCCTYAIVLLIFLA